MLVGVGLLSAAAIFALPQVEQVTQHQFDRYILPTGPSHVGFTESLGVTSVDELLGSDDLVLRIYGPHVDYLRGRVYDNFDHGRWESASRAPAVLVSTTTGERRGPGVTEIHALGPLRERDPRARFFVPLGAQHIGTATGTALVDEVGMLQPAPGAAATLVSFDVGAPEHPVASPTDRDLRVPDTLRAVLDPIAADWTRGASTPLAKLAAIEQHLGQDFAYSLDRAPASREPPIVHFLRTSRRGHCELFATAMALLARTVGVPARVVGGFRVAEHNAIGDYDVVREKNAHAWVEAWVDARGWQTFDPTPATEANLRREQSTFSALLDATRAAAERALDRLGQVRPRYAAVVLAVAAALLVALRVVRRRQRQQARTTPADRTADPLPCFVRLESALARLGHARPPTEPLERYAERLRGAALERAADAVLDYGALRYGGIGEAASVMRKVEACASELRDQVARR